MMGIPSPIVHLVAIQIGINVTITDGQCGN